MPRGSHAWKGANWVPSTPPIREIDGTPIHLDPESGKFFVRAGDGWQGYPSLTAAERSLTVIATGPVKAVRLVGNWDLRVSRAKVIEIATYNKRAESFRLADGEKVRNYEAIYQHDPAILEELTDLECEWKDLAGRWKATTDKLRRLYPDDLAALRRVPTSAGETPEARLGESRLDEARLE